jgi:hypothetical protein
MELVITYENENESQIFREPIHTTLYFYTFWREGADEIGRLEKNRTEKNDYLKTKRQFLMKRWLRTGDALALRQTRKQRPTPIFVADVCKQVSQLRVRSLAVAR